MPILHLCSRIFTGAPKVKDNRPGRLITFALSGALRMARRARR